MAKSGTAVAAWLVACVLATTASAQAPTPPAPRPLVPPERPPLAPAPAPAPVAVEAPFVPPSDMLWFSTDLMLLNMSAPRRSLPIVTTGNPYVDNCAGAIGQPSTRVLFGGNDLLNENAGALRFVLGAWLDNNHSFGLEANGFTAFTQNRNFQQSSDGSGNAPLYLSGYNVQTGREDSAVIADPYQQFSGSIVAKTDLKLWGVEANALFNLRRDAGFEWTFLTGARYVDLRESFSLSATSRDLLFNQYITLADRFDTANQFLGYQVGSRMRWRYDRLLFDATGKIAIGGIGLTRTVAGSSRSAGPDATNPGTFPGGFYAQPSNMGRSSDVDFAFLPALELKLAYQVTTGVYASIGYDIFCLTHVARVVDQIDRNLNLSQSAVLGSQTPAGPIAPGGPTDRTSFLVQGLAVGLEIRY